VVGTLAVAKSAADGYTLLLAGVSHSVHEFLHEKPPFNPSGGFHAYYVHRTIRLRPGRPSDNPRQLGRGPGKARPRKAR